MIESSLRVDNLRESTVFFFILFICFFKNFYVLEVLGTKFHENFLEQLCQKIVERGFKNDPKNQTSFVYYFPLYFLGCFHIYESS